VITKTVDVANIDSVSLEGIGNVYIEQGDTESLSIEAEDNIMPLLVTRVNGNELVLTTQPNQNINPTKPVVYNLTVKDLNALSLKGSGNITAEPIQSDKMDLSLQGSGNIKLKELNAGDLSMELDGSGNIDIDQLTTGTIRSSVNGSGDIQLAGTADSQDISFSGSGNYRAGDLESDSVQVDIPGSSDITVWVNKDLKANIDGSGTIRYYGKPTVNQTGNGSGKLISMGEK
jgi:hypothetical protein